MEQLVRYIVQNLVSNKDAVKIVTEQDGENTFTIKVVVDKADLGRVIGKGGKIAQSIRAIVKTASVLDENKARYFVKFED